jgi:small redox-active disulfide protein 2
MDIKILGSGCATCQRLEALTRQAATDLGLAVEIDHVSDPGEIASWGVMSTPALVIDDEVVLSGRVPALEDLERMLAAR